MRVFLSATEIGGQKQAMKVFLSGLEQGEGGGQKPAMKAELEKHADISQQPRKRVEQDCAKQVLGGGFSSLPVGDPPLLWNLMSYYYIGNDEQYAELIRDNSELILIDSGAHSFQKGKKVDWLEYTKRYADFIGRFDRDSVLGYFEMDVDNVLGYERVLDLREVLHERTGMPDKIIPVWHKNRGIADFKNMCADRAGKIIAITGFKNEDIRDEQYLMFLKEAKKHGCKVHCLGMTRKSILDKVPFDYVDSSSWAQQALYGKVGKRKVAREFSKTNRDEVFIASYLEAMEMQKHYYDYWQGV